MLDGNYKTSTHLVQVGVPQKVGLQLQVQTGAANLNDTRQEASVDFLNTLDFVTGMPEFDLPTGYTANSVSARIVDNQYHPVAVPLPPAWALLLAGGGVALRGLRSGNSRQTTPALSREVRDRHVPNDAACRD